jgi:hypothetical protein
MSTRPVGRTQKTLESKIKRVDYLLFVDMRILGAIGTIGMIRAQEGEQKGGESPPFLFVRRVTSSIFQSTVQVMAPSSGGLVVRKLSSCPFKA